MLDQQVKRFPGRASSVKKRHTRQDRGGADCVVLPAAGWFPLFRCQGLLTGTFTTALQKYITITSILPRQEEREKQRKRECACAWMDLWVGAEGASAGVKNQARRAQARERTGWMPRR